MATQTVDPWTGNLDSWLIEHAGLPSSEISGASEYTSDGSQTRIASDYERMLCFYSVSICTNTKSSQRRFGGGLEASKYYVRGTKQKGDL